MIALRHWLRGVVFGAVLLAGGFAHAQQLAAIPPLDSPVVDTTGTLSPTQKQALVQQALALQQRKGSQLQVLMVPTTQPEDDRAVHDARVRAVQAGAQGRR